MRLIVEFFRGPRDGQILVGNPENPILDEATAIYRTLHADLADDTVWTHTEYAVRRLGALTAPAINQAIAVGCRFPGHLYQLVDARHTAEETRLALVHRGPA